MMNLFNGGFGGSDFLGIGIAGFILVLAWSIVWKGLALWHAARRGEKVWYIVMLAVNTIGILEIIYLFAVAKVQKKEAPKIQEVQ